MNGTLYSSNPCDWLRKRFHKTVTKQTLLCYASQCYATGIQEQYKIQVLCGLLVWIMGLFCSPKDWWHIAFHCCVSWQGMIAHVVAVIWERLDIIITGTSFYGFCVPDWVIQVGHQMTVESFCHSWILSTHLWKPFCRVWEARKWVACKDKWGNKAKQGLSAVH